MVELFEMGRVSSRGQIAIPIDIRKEMRLDKGSRVIFLLEEDTLLIKKVSIETWESLTQPLRIQKKKIEQEDVTSLIHRMRKK